MVAAMTAMLTVTFAATSMGGCGQRRSAGATGDPSAPPGASSATASATSVSTAATVTTTTTNGTSEGASDRPSGATGAPDGAPELRESRDDLMEARPLAWSSWQEVEPGVIEVTFLTGPASCLGVHAAVDQGAEQVVINLTQGTYPGADTTCRAIALQARMRITLEGPLDGRAVVQTGAPATP